MRARWTSALVCACLLLALCACNRSDKKVLKDLKVAAPMTQDTEAPEYVVFDIKPLESRTGSLWLATYFANGKTAKFRIEMVPDSKRTDDGIPIQFGDGRFMAEAGSDASTLLLDLKRALSAKQMPAQVKRVNQLSFKFVNLGEHMSHAEGGGFNADPKGDWTACKIFIGEGEDEGEVFLNFNPVAGKGEFSIKDEEYGDIVLRELAKVL